MDDPADEEPRRLMAHGPEGTTLVRELVDAFVVDFDDTFRFHLALVRDGVEGPRTLRIIDASQAGRTWDVRDDLGESAVWIG